MLEVKRAQKLIPTKYEIGDQIEIDIMQFGKYTATCQKVEEETSLFMFDEVVSFQQMNETCTNAGGFAKSDLKEWMNNILLIYFPDDVVWNMKTFEDDSALRLPTVAEMFGPKAFGTRYGIEEVERLPLMENRRNRIVSDEWTEYAWYWLSNSMTALNNKEDFAFIADTGRISHGKATNIYGVRPMFQLLNHERSE